VAQGEGPEFKSQYHKKKMPDPRQDLSLHSLWGQEALLDPGHMSLWVLSSTARRAIPVYPKKAQLENRGSFFAFWFDLGWFGLEFF
jgi:hypothetical protein